MKNSICDKIWYGSNYKAKLALRIFKDRGLDVRSTYKCPRCDGWHLTSKTSNKMPIPTDVRGEFGLSDGDIAKEVQDILELADVGINIQDIGRIRL